MRPVVCTGFDITDPLQKYLEVGHNIDLTPVSRSDPEIEEAEAEDDDEDAQAVSPEFAALTDKVAFVGSCRTHFCRLRKGAPEEDRKLLEIPYCESSVPPRSVIRVWILGLTRPTDLDKQFPETSWQRRLFIPTGAHTRDRYISGALNTPSEQDLKAIQSFIESANRLLPDDAARERASFKLQDLQYEVRPARALSLPLYDRAEREVRPLWSSIIGINALTRDVVRRSCFLLVFCRCFARKPPVS